MILVFESERPPLIQTQLVSMGISDALFSSKHATLLCETTTQKKALQVIRNNGSKEKSCHPRLVTKIVCLRALCLLSRFLHEVSTYILIY